MFELARLRCLYNRNFDESSRSPPSTSMESDTCYDDVDWIPFSSTYATLLELAEKYVLGFLDSSRHSVTA